MKKFNKFIGFYGEELAQSFLKKHNHKIISTNFQTRLGEIDIISFDDDILVFTEVKTRFNKNFGSPSESISKSKIKNILKVANQYIYLKKATNFFIRFDVVEIYLDDSSNNFKSIHIKDAFRAN